QMLSPGSTASRPAWRARIFSVKVNEGMVGRLRRAEEGLPSHYTTLAERLAGRRGPGQPLRPTSPPSRAPGRGQNRAGCALRCRGGGSTGGLVFAPSILRNRLTHRPKGPVVVRQGVQVEPRRG